MLAHHPETGQPIRILRSDAQITQSRRTLVWLQSGYNVSTRWQRWNCIITDPTAWQGAAVAVIVSDFQEAWIPILKTLENSALIVCKCMDVYRKAGLQVENYLSYNDLFNMYPFLGEPVKNSDPIEKVVVSVAHILRFPYLAWSPTRVDIGVKAQLTAWYASGGQQQPLPANAIAEEVVPACWLIQQYFKHPNARRQRELALCLEKNLANPYIDRILLLNEQAEELPDSDKLVEHVIGHRMTYKDVMDAIRTDVPAGAFVVFSNSDIWCDESLQVLWAVPMVEKRLFLALLRWEGEEPTLYGPRPDSQDTWIVAKDTVDFVPTEEDFGFPFGKPGCDNAIALTMLRKRCLVVNPAYSLKTYHVHASNIRNYNPRDILYKQMYLYIDPTPIQLFAVEQHMKAWEKGHVIHDSFSRRIHGSDVDIKTVCRILKDRGDVLGADANLWTPTSLPTYELKNAFVSDSGLLSNFQAIFTGGHEAWKQGWQESQISVISTTIHVPALISVTAQNESWKSLASWCLDILPTVLRLRKTGEYEFLVPTLPDVPPFLYDCRWPDEHIGTVPHIPNTQYYCNKILATAPIQQRISKEDVGLLRELLPPPLPSVPLLVVCLDDVFTEGWYEEWRTCHASALKGMRTMTIAPQESNRVRRYAFQSAAWILGRREALQWIWMAKSGTRVLEWMLETEVTSDIVHLAGAAECKYIVALLTASDPVELRQQAILKFGPLWREHAFKEIAAVVEKPVIRLPAGKALEGMWYQGPFRDMVRIWEERGYCTVLETEDSSYVWWGEIGDVLLYDWDTPRWLHSVNYAMALFGNCAPPEPEGHRQSVWSYWGKHPRLLEDVERLGWSDRPIVSAFMGKVENGIQKAHRSTDWESVIEVFSMPTDSTESPYPYSPSEYIETLRKSRFGLCLAGTGSKCHREIECMALGTVPIVAGVDMSGYLVPPQEGIHFLRATPANVTRVISEITEEKWEEMSAACHAWWRQNASAEGLFRLTWARIEQCRPTQGLFMPPWSPKH